ncbi:MAG: hypothetical protein GX093_04690 [Xanthomonadaceae bacterium]|nr:hypothetical protein [Xanthomonadaceae bacterium]
MNEMLKSLGWPRDDVNAAIRSRWRLHALALLLLALCLPVYLTFANTLDRLEVTEQYNLLFDADANRGAKCFANGWASGRTIVHPNLCNLTNPLVRVTAGALAVLGLAEGGAELRHRVALALVPIVSSLTVLLVFATFLTLRCGAPGAFLLALLYGVSFSQLIFGSMPEHFALSGFALVLTLWLLSQAVEHRRYSLPLWAVAGVLSLSITITNFLLFGLALLAALGLRQPWRQACRWGLSVVALAFALTLLIKLPLDALYGGADNTVGRLVRFTTDYMRDGGPLQALAGYPMQLVASIVGPETLVVPDRLVQEGARYDFQFSLEGARFVGGLSQAAALSVAALLVAGCAHGLRSLVARNRGELALFVTAIGTLLFNGLLHAFWGNGYFLYSQHWQFASWILLAWPLRTRLRHPALAVCAIALVLVAVNNFQEVARMLDILEQAQAMKAGGD